jgi:hypothetical protein
MKKIIVALVVLALAVPSMAAVTISATDDGNNDGWVTIGYVQSDTSAGKRPRAFALDLSVSAGEICEVDTSGCEPFGIYMGTIEIDGEGFVTDYGSPVAPADDPGAAGPLGSGAVTLEMGSLYDPCAPGADQPAFSGTLIKVKLNTSCNLTVAANTARAAGGVVLEDGTTPGAGLPVGPVAVAVVYGGPDYAEWHTVGDPVGWATADQCHGNADNRGQGFGSAIKVSTWDLEVMVPNYGANPLVAVLTSGGDTVPGINADFAHDGQGFGGALRVSTNDLAVLVEYYGDSSGVPTDCQSCAPVSP